MARALDELKAELDELLRHVREHGERLQRDIDALKRRAEEREQKHLPDEKSVPPDSPGPMWNE